MVDTFLEIHDNATMIKSLLERADLLTEEILVDFLCALENKRMIYPRDTQIARMKGEILQETIASAQKAIDKLAEDTRTDSTSDAPKNHRDMTRAERIDEIMNQICTFTGMIENFPDWLERMKHLNFVAMCLAMGCNDYNFTCKEPGQE